jgi:trimeric autotransporter adhesin
MCLLRAVFLTLVMSWSSSSQTYTISTFAGGGLPVNIPATSAGLDPIYFVTADRAGNLFFVDQGSVLLLNATTGVLTLVAGIGTPGFSGDNGPATSAQLNYPCGVAVDSAGNLYIAELNNNRIRRVSNGVITTVAGNGTPGFSGDNGPATGAELAGPEGVAVDSAGNLYIADTGNSRIRRVSNGVITTVAGNGCGSNGCGFSGDNGPATSAELTNAEGIAVDSAGNLYIADTYNQRIRRVSNGVITTVAGNGARGFGGDNGPATSAGLSGPAGVAVDSAGNLY